MLYYYKLLRFDIFFQNGMFFISESQIIEPVPDHVDRLYTSVHNARLLRSQYQVRINIYTSLNEINVY